MWPLLSHFNQGGWQHAIRGGGGQGKVRFSYILVCSCYEGWGGGKPSLTQANLYGPLY